MTTGSSTLFASSDPASSSFDSRALPPAHAIISDLSATAVFTEATGMYVPLADTASLSASGMDILGLQPSGELFGGVGDGGGPGGGMGGYEAYLAGANGLEGYGTAYDAGGDVGAKAGVYATRGDALGPGHTLAQGFGPGDAEAVHAFYGGDGYYGNGSAGAGATQGGRGY